MLRRLIQFWKHRNESTAHELADDSRVEALYQQGIQAFTSQRYAEAVHCALQALELDPGLAPIQYLLGSAYLEMAQHRRAAQVFSTCLALKPAYPLVQYALLNGAIAKVRDQQLVSSYIQGATLPTLSHTLRISVIICSIDAERYARVCANYHTLLAGIAHEIIGIHDAKSLCEGYNRGLRQAHGDYLIFSHDDIEIVTPDFAAKLVSYLQRFDLIGIAGTTRLSGPAWVHSGWPYFHGQVGSRNTATGQLVVQCYDIRGACTPQAQAMDGVFLAVRRELTQRVMFDETRFDGWHLYDVDFTFSAYLAGFRTAICQDICLLHASEGDWNDAWQHYANVFMAKHGANLSERVHTDFGELCSVPLASIPEWLSVTETLNDMSIAAQP